MRALFALPLLAMAACQVTKDDANDSVTVEYNQDVAENGLEDAGNLAENVGEAIANDVGEAADKVENTDVDVEVDTNAN
ncbi:MAG TPA: hypothetical protein VFO32_03600 [Sphingomicrobium sp.]|jgi:hypothetical protein|nr:hypothetical protein [Sphingomicrobium sp.]